MGTSGGPKQYQTELSRSKNLHTYALPVLLRIVIPQTSVYVDDPVCSTLGQDGCRPGLCVLDILFHESDTENLFFFGGCRSRPRRPSRGRRRQLGDTAVQQGVILFKGRRLLNAAFFVVVGVINRERLVQAIWGRGAWRDRGLSKWLTEWLVHDTDLLPSRAGGIDACEGHVLISDDPALRQRRL